MRIACVLSAAELDGNAADLVIFPEGVCVSELEAAASAQPEAVIVGAIQCGPYSRGVVWHKGMDHIDYLKVGTDGRTQGSGNCDQLPVAHFPTFSVAVLVCMDIDNPHFSATVREALRASPNDVKVLCIPADMGDYWLQGDKLPFPTLYAGMYVALCNSTVTHDSRCKSFVADRDGKKVRIQSATEPIYVDVL